MSNLDDLVTLLRDYANEYGYDWVPFDGELPDGVKFIDEQELDQRRWVASMLTIVEFRGDLYGIEWDRGLTESQDSECNIDDDGIVYPVDKVEKVVYTYKRK